MLVQLDAGAVAPTPWRNGAGVTRELHHCTDDVGATLWRVSVADLHADAEFSAFPGLQRLFVPMGPVILVVDGERRRLVGGEPARFDGESDVSIRVPAPTRALNVMTRRGLFEAHAALLDPATADVQIREVTHD